MDVGLKLKERRAVRFWRKEPSNYEIAYWLGVKAKDAVRRKSLVTALDYADAYELVAKHTNATTKRIYVKLGHKK